MRKLEIAFFKYKSPAFSYFLKLSKWFEKECRR